MQRTNPIDFFDGLPFKALNLPSLWMLTQHLCNWCRIFMWASLTCTWMNEGEDNMLVSISITLGQRRIEDTIICNVNLAKDRDRKMSGPI